jgi:hypothetical protein
MAAARSCGVREHSLLLSASREVQPTKRSPECSRRKWGARSPVRRGNSMSGSAVRILVVGDTSPSTLATLQRLEKEGWRSHCVNTIAEAEGALKMIRFDVILAGENVGEGSGYDLTDSVVELGCTLLVSIALSDASLWLPVVHRGMLTLGDRALNSSMLQLEVAEALSARTRASPAARKGRGCTAEAAADRPISGLDRRTGPEERRRQPASNGAGPKRFLPPRRKTVPAAGTALSIPDEAAIKHESGEPRGLPRGGVSGRHFR